MISISKKIFYILGTCVFLIIFLYINHANAAKCGKNEIFKDGKCQYDYAKFFEDYEKKNKKKKFFKKITGMTYFEKRKECKEWADKAETVYRGKERYKSCMKGE